MPREWCAWCHLSRTVMDHTIAAHPDHSEYLVTTLSCGHKIVIDP